MIGRTAPDRAEDQLLAGARAGDRRALDQLLRCHQEAMYAICRRITGNDADALDATQEALLAVVRGIKAFDGRSQLSTWIYRVTTNACLDELRRRRRRPVPGLPDAADDARSSPPAMDDGVADRLDIDRALQNVPVEFRVAVVLRDLCSLDYAWIAEVLDVPIGTVRSRIARGRAALVRELAGNQMAPPRRPTTDPSRPPPPTIDEP